MGISVKLPVGIESFEKIRTENFYYVDKTGLIRDLLNNWGEVNLFTRPRRFGKSLNMSMLKCFFEPGCKKELFDGLEISGETALCEKYMGQFPVMSISLKGVDGDSFNGAKEMLRSLIGEEAMRFRFLADSLRLEAEERKRYAALTDVNGRGEYTMPDSLLCNSLLLLSKYLHKHYGQKVVLLIDEYDVPLDKAYRAGYYDSMVGLIHSLFLQVLKTNDSLQFAVLTGCLRISKESIFTGLNNPKILSVLDVRFHEYFGFTDREVRRLLDFYGLADAYGSVKEWYDGYRFGNVDVYCPWDVINYCDLLRADRKARPQNYWANTGSTDMIKRLLQKAKSTTKSELEGLIAGGIVRKEIRQELTYSDLDTSLDNLWSLLFTTGYLTQRGETALGEELCLAIPNQEIRQIFIRQIMEWFDEETGKDTVKLDGLFCALKCGDAPSVEKLLNDYLRRMISIRDTGGRQGQKESFYHGFLLGLLSHMEGWEIFSNRESGEGYSDIIMTDETGGTGIVFEIKYAQEGRLEEACREALAQIDGRRYAEALREDGTETILKYGVACHKKRCMVMTG